MRSVIFFWRSSLKVLTPKLGSIASEGSVEGEDAKRQ